MQTFSLQSGSSGNAIYVEAAGQRLLFDLGISCRQANLRLNERGRFLRDVDAIIVSHDHHDHVCGIGACQRRFGLPVYITDETRRACAHKLGKVANLRTFHAGDVLRIGDVRIETVPTPHDGADGVCFVVAAEGRRLGIFTDLGYAFPELHTALANVDAAFLESNYDVALLANGPYPAHLKMRIRGPGGHLSNDEAAALLANVDPTRLAWVMLAHLSEHNNTPAAALTTHHNRLGMTVHLGVASRQTASTVLRV